MSSLPVVLLAFLVSAPSPLPDQAVTVRVTHGALVPLCLDSADVAHRARKWKLAPGEHTLTLTTHNQPRAGIASPDAGIGRIHVTLVAGHKYDVELRAVAGAYSTRAWKKAEWSPVVRDRTTDAVVSDAVEWIDAGCR
jgi:hypothetical protein